MATFAVVNPNAFTHIVRAAESDIDELGHVNNVVYVRWIQEVAYAHWLYAANAEIRMKYSWVLLRHEIDYRKPAFLNDEVKGFTWVGNHEGPRFERFVTLVHAATGNVLAESKTLWCLLDAKSMKPRRIGQDIIDILKLGQVI